MLPINLMIITEGMEIYEFGIVEYYVRSESGCMIELQDQAYYVPGLPKDLRIISPQGICISEGYKGTFIANCHDEHDSYVEPNLKEDKLSWQKTKIVQKFQVKYEPKNNLPTHEAILPNQGQKEDKALASTICVTNKANQNLTSLYKYVQLCIDGPSIFQTVDDGVGDTIVFTITKRRQKAMNFPVWVQFLNLCDKTLVFPRIIAEQESNVIQRITPRTNVNRSRNHTKIQYLVQ